VKIKRGSTSVRRLIFIADSSSTTGAGLASLVYNTSSLVAYYFAGDLSNEVQITLATATLGTYASGGFVAVDNTNMPGWYEIGIPDAALDAGNEVAIQLRGAANMVPVNIYIELDAFDYQTATQPVNVTQFGGTNITAAAGIPEVKVASIADNAITAASMASDAGTEIGAAVLTALGTGSWATAITDKTGNLPSDPADQSIIIAATDAVMSRLGEPTGESMSADIATLATAASITTLRGADSDTLKTLSDQIDGISAGTGTGARTVTITVNDGTTVLQNARVRVVEGVNTYTGLTNASGVVVFNLDDATYTVSITKSGYTYSGTTLIVDGTETRTYSMTVVSVTPPDDAALSAVEVICLNSVGAAESGVAIDFRIADIPSGDVNRAYRGLKHTETSDGDGIARFELVRGATYEWKRGTADEWARIVVDNDSATSVTSVIGSP